MDKWQNLLKHLLAISFYNKCLRQDYPELSSDGKSQSILEANIVCGTYYMNPSLNLLEDRIAVKT